MSDGIDLFSPFILAQLQQDPTLLAALSGGGGDNAGGDPMSVLLGNQMVPREALAQNLGINLLGGTTPLTRMAADVPPGSTLPPLPTTETIPAPPPPGRAPLMTQAQQQDEAIRLGLRTPFPPDQRFNSRGEAISPDLFKPDIGGAAGGVPDLGTAKISPEIVRGWQEANAQGRNPPVEPLPRLPPGSNPAVVPPIPPPGSVPAVVPPIPPPGSVPPGATAPAAPVAVAPTSGAASPAVAAGGGGIATGGGFNPNALLQMLAANMMRNQQNDIYDKMLEFGLGTMAAASEPGATTVGSLGRGGLMALKGGREREAASMKQLLEAGQLTNVLSEAGLRNDKTQALGTYGAVMAGIDPSWVSGEATPATGGAGATAAPPKAAETYGFATSIGASPNEAALLTSAIENESGFDPTKTHDAEAMAKQGLPPGYGLFGHNGDRLAAMRQQYGQNPSWQDQMRFALAELRTRPEGMGINDVKTAEELTERQMRFEQPKRTPETKDGNFAARLESTRRYMTAPPVARTTEGSGGAAGEPPQPLVSAGSDETPAVPASAGGDPSGSVTAQRAAEAGLPPLTTPTGKVNVAFARRMSALAERAGLTNQAAYWSKVASAPDGHVWLPNGTLAPIKGDTRTDPDMIRQKAEIEARAKVGPEIAVATAKSGLDTRREEEITKLREKIQHDNKMTQMEKQNELDILKNVELQKETQKREAYIKNMDPIKLGPTDTALLTADSQQAKSVREMYAATGKMPKGVSINPDGSITLTGNLGADFANKLHTHLSESFNKRRDGAVSAYADLKSISMAEDMLEKGIFSGPLAERKLKASEYLATYAPQFGKYTATAANTRAFMIQRGHAVANMLGSGAFGTAQSITDQDREYVKMMQNGDINIPEEGIRRVFEISRLISAEKIALFDSEAENFENRYGITNLRVGMPPATPRATGGVTDDGSLRFQVPGAR